MTFDSAHHQQHLADPSLDRKESHAGIPPAESAPLKLTYPEMNNEYCNESEIQNWEDEGGAGFAVRRGTARFDSLTGNSPLTAHIEAAHTFADAGHYDRAYTELEAAAARYMRYHTIIRQSLEGTISRLASEASAAAPPHPVALPLVRLHSKLPA